MKWDSVFIVVGLICHFYPVALVNNLVVRPSAHLFMILDSIP